MTTWHPDSLCGSNCRLADQKHNRRAAATQPKPKQAISKHKKNNKKLNTPSTHNKGETTQTNNSSPMFRRGSGIFCCVYGFCVFSSLVWGLKNQQPKTNIQPCVSDRVRICVCCFVLLVFLHVLACSGFTVVHMLYRLDSHSFSIVSFHEFILCLLSLKYGAI